jgi:hypothetical protein
MRLSTLLRPALIGLGCVALAVVPACSSGGGKSSSGGASGGSQKEYCAALKTLYDMLQPYSGSTVPADQNAQVAAQVVEAMHQAPPELSNDFAKSITGDTYARDNVNQYNKSKCGIDTSSLRLATP